MMARRGIVASRKMTAADFGAVCHLLPNLSPERLSIARAVLVDGQTYQDAAAKFGMTRQAATTAIKPVWAAYERYQAAKETERLAIEAALPGCKQITLCVPAELLPQLQALIDSHRSKQ
ncbi:transcriptional regulator [Burkholderia sp. Ac-20345]|uniref:TrfB-related DNA-binding protein n=1 Tax=Burkholderia sp. Ac-20345 TaxID=2703891 RepID=UPI00197BF57E|nr:TrfB-related DNA-binding protein [Burkholderia sp. Ac-20345]MBN3780499.1 transcriptional regulator [Burkholderia sp. Ac-20345]